MAVQTLSDPSTLEEAAAGVDVCRRCDLWRNATQGVPGEGPSDARMMLVGEQPGDCRWWLDAERRIIRPRVVVAMGATAALGVFGKPTPIAANRQQAIQLPDESQGVVTWHPSFLLRVPDAEAKARAYAEFVQDLRFAWELAG